MSSLSHLDVSVFDDIDDPDKFLNGENSGSITVINSLGL